MNARPSGDEGRVATVRAWPRALVMLLLACVLLQGTAVQSHVHFTHATSAFTQAAGERSRQISNPVNDRDPAGDCPLCQESAMAGA